MGPGEGASNQVCLLAIELGKLVAQNGWLLLTGGRDIGVMKAALKGAKQANGTTIGVLPGHNRDQCSPYVDIPIVTGIGEARNVINILTSDVIVACGMGAGTASEISFAIKKKKPLILLKPGAHATAFFSELDPTIQIVDTPAQVISALKKIPNRNPTW